MLVSWPVNSPPTLLCSLKREKHHEGEQLGNHFVDNDGDVVDVDEGLPEECSPEQNHLGKKERELLRVTVCCLRNRIGFKHSFKHDGDGDHDDQVTSRR